MSTEASPATIEEVSSELLALREEPIEGTVVDLLPYSARHHEVVVAMRNEQRASYFLHQPEPLTLEKQALWFAGYLSRTDDLQWVIANKSGTVVGATALYGIASDRSRAEKGRLVVNDAMSREAPYVLEAELLLLDTAFSRLAIKHIDTCVRHDNSTMQSINARFGFVRSGEHDIRGVVYFDYVLNTDDYRPDAMRETLRAWVGRRSSRPPGTKA